MLAIDRILVGVDEGQLADAAVIAALHAARMCRAQLEFVHCVSIQAGGLARLRKDLLAELHAEAAVEARKRCAKRLLGLLKPFATTPAEIEEWLHVAVGRPSTVLLERAAAHGNSLVVLGSHRQRGLLDFGGTTREMLAQLTQPVWVQDAKPWKDIQRILVPLDLSPASVAVLQTARALAAKAEAELTVLHCYEPLTLPYVNASRFTELNEELRGETQEQFEAAVEESFPRGEVPMQTKFERGDVDATILEHARGHDLIVIGTHGRSALGRAILGSHAYRIVQAAEVPVVVVPQPDVEMLEAP